MRGSQSVENMRAALMDLLGRTGRGIQNIDDAYAARVADLLRTEQGTAGSAIRNAAAEVVGFPSFRGPGIVEGIDRTVNPNAYRAQQVMAHAAPYISGGIRYGVPIAGVSLAGKGLMDIMDALDAEEAMEYHDEHLMIPFNPQA